MRVKYYAEGGGRTGGLSSKKMKEVEDKWGPFESGGTTFKKGDGHSKRGKPASRKKTGGGIYQHLKVLEREKGNQGA